MIITVLNGSARENGNTEIMVDEFVRGAKEKGHIVNKINVGNKNVSGCKGCQYCFANDGKCIQEDDMQEIIKVIDETEMIVFASPIYWFDINGQLKNVIDRMYARGRKGFTIKKSALLLDARLEGVFEAAEAQYKMMSGFLKWEDMGIISIAGMNNKGDMKNSEKLKDVYELGKSL